MIILIISLSSVIAYDLSEYPSPFIKDGKFDGVLVVGDTAPADDVIALSNIIASFQFLVLDKLAKDNVGVDSLYENQTRTYSFNNVYYEITLNFVNADTAQFIVNGMTTDILSPGESEKLLGGHILTLAGIKSENDLYYAIFSLSEKELDAKDILIEVGAAKLASEVDNLKKVNSILVGHACDNPLVAEVSGRKNCKEGYEKNVGLIEAYEMPNGKVSLVVTGYSTKDTLNAADILSSFQNYKGSFAGSKIRILKKGGKLVAESVELKNINEKPKSYSEDNFKFSIIIFLVLIVALIVLLFYTRITKSRQRTKFKYSTKKR